MVMCEAQALSPGNALPGGRVAPLYIPGDVDVPVAFVLEEALVDATGEGI